MASRHSRPVSSTSDVAIGDTVILRDNRILNIKHITNNDPVDKGNHIIFGVELRLAESLDGLIAWLPGEYCFIRQEISGNEHFAKARFFEIAGKLDLQIRPASDSSVGPDSQNGRDALSPQIFVRREFMELFPNYQAFQAHERRNVNGYSVVREGCIRPVLRGHAIRNGYFSDEEYRNRFRGQTIKGGSGHRQVRRQDESNHTDRTDQRRNTQRETVRSSTSLTTISLRAYTAADFFCGAGGITRGMKGARFQVMYGVDQDRVALSTWEDNFDYAIPYCMDITEILGRALELGLKVDVVHLSPPCQAFSRANTRGKNSPDYQAKKDLLFSVHTLLEKVQPRIVTVEETSGLIDTEEHKIEFAGLVGHFTQVGYSVRWKILDMQFYGVPQRRQRLFFIASCPGEPLPDFPPYTHSVNGSSGLKKVVTINEALAAIPRGADHHNPDDLRLQIDKTPYDGNRVCNTVCCSGATMRLPGENPTTQYHPSGKRKFTIREWAVLQGFPSQHIFPEIEPGQVSSSALMRQIGNAVPPTFSRILFNHIRKHLERVDHGPDNPIVLF